MRILIIALILFSSNLFGQHKEHLYSRTQSEFDKLTEKAKKTDSIIVASNKMEYREKYITRGLSEGSIKLTDSLKVVIGSGGFSTYTYTNDKTNKIIKAKHNQTVHYKYDVKDSLNANTERLEISIYYKNEKAYYAEFNEYHYDNEKVISTNRFYLQLNATRDEIYYSNDFQKGITNYILKLSEDIISKK
jgi:hypothetical protein